ncbi:MAG: 3-phosphoshikimate 1-carboxyvinyltransferase [Erysipelotrichaceae bacterium]|nr:3-phosphoshikimate 1-carboxyvinyltransferase [Erysipelotrichaceae bacterium]
MLVTIEPSKCIEKQIRIPSSKSLGHRAIICASLAKGTSHIYNVDMSKDLEATIGCMEQLGAKILKKGNTLEITGIECFENREYTLWCNESGSTLRFMIPIASLTKQKVTLQGTKRLLERPQNIYQNIFSHFEHNEQEIVVEECLKSGNYEIDGNVSSQFISGLLFALPLCDNDSQIKIQGEFASKSYVDLTVDMLKQFGVVVEWIDDTTIFIKGNQIYQSQNVTIEADYSQLAFFAGLGALGIPITCLHANPNSLQGDKAILDILTNMGCSIVWNEDGVCVKGDSLHSTTIDLQNCPDLGPILFVCASLAEGTTHFINCKRLRIKESDRICAMECELRKLGVDLLTTEDEVWITGSKKWNTPCMVDGHNDHRIVMALAIGAIVSENGITIQGAEAVSKSYPHFFDDLAKLGIKIKGLENF